MDLKEERNMILDMVAEGRITVDDAKQLLDALEKSARKHDGKDEFIASPGMDFHIPEVRIPNVGNIINRAYRHARPKIHTHFGDLEDIREDMEDEIERLRDQLNALKEESARMAEELKKQTGQPRRNEEDWTT
jgi:hypothetical protein